MKHSTLCPNYKLTEAKLCFLPKLHNKTMLSSLRTSDRVLLQTSCVFVCLWSAAPPVSSLGARRPERLPVHSAPPGLHLLRAPLQWQGWPLARTGPGHLHRCAAAPPHSTPITRARPKALRNLTPPGPLDVLSASARIV